MADKSPITKQGHDALQNELKNLKTVERPKTIKAIATARELGDLSENADYHAARERQSFIEGRIGFLEDRLTRLEVVDISRLSGGKVSFGATVILEDSETQTKVTYQIVGEEEVDVKLGKISYKSPIAKAIISKEKDDDVTVITPKGQKDYTIIDVLYK